MSVQESSVKPRRILDTAAAVVTLGLAVLIFFASAMGWGQTNGKWLVLIVIFYALAWLVLRNQAYLVLVSVILASTLPGIIFSKMLVLPGLAGNLRLEYLVFILLLVLLILNRRPAGAKMPLDVPVGIFMLFQGIALLFALLRGDTQSIAVGPVIRLFEAYAFYFLASRLTMREQIPGLVRTLTVIGGLVAIVIILVTITGSKNLYINLISTSPDLQDVVSSNFYAHFFRGVESARIGYTAAEPLLLLTVILSTLMIFQVGWQPLQYSLLTFLVAIRMLVSGQKFQFVYLVVTLLLSPVMLWLRPAGEKGKMRSSSWVMLGLLALGMVLLLSSGAWAEKWAVLVARSSFWFISEEVRSMAQYRGIQLAWSEILHNPFAWLTGFSPFHVTVTRNWDINLGFLVTLYYYGLGGVIALLALLGSSIFQALRLLRTKLAQEERALVSAVAIFIFIYVASGFVRGMIFNENGSSVLVFSICLGWVQVIWRDIQSGSTRQITGRS
jgi:hypothetical protein